MSSRGYADLPANKRPSPLSIGCVFGSSKGTTSGYAGAWIAVSDRDALTMLVKDIEFLANLEARLATDGPVLYTDKGYAYAHPAVGMRTSAEESIRKWMNHLGLTPADRAKLGIAMVESQSRIEKYRDRLAAKDGHRAG